MNGDRQVSDGVDSNSDSGSDGDGYSSDSGDGRGSNGVMMVRQSLDSDCCTGVSIPFMVL